MRPSVRLAWTSALCLLAICEVAHANPLHAESRGRRGFSALLRPYLAADVEYAQRNNAAWALMRNGDQQGALNELQQAAHGFLSLQDTLTNVLKGLLAHSLIRVPTLWLMLTLLNGRPPLHWVILYEGFLYALKVGTIRVALSVFAAAGVGNVVGLVIALPVVLFAAVFVLMGKFNIGLLRGLLALLAASVLNLTLTHLL